MRAAVRPSLLPWLQSSVQLSLARAAILQHTPPCAVAQTASLPSQRRGPVSVPSSRSRPADGVGLGRIRHLLPLVQRVSLLNYSSFISSREMSLTPMLPRDASLSVMYPASSLLSSCQPPPEPLSPCSGGGEPSRYDTSQGQQQSLDEHSQPSLTLAQPRLGSTPSRHPQL